MQLMIDFHCHAESEAIDEEPDEQAIDVLMEACLEFKARLNEIAEGKTFGAVTISHICMDQIAGVGLVRMDIFEPLDRPGPEDLQL